MYRGFFFFSFFPFQNLLLEFSFSMGKVFTFAVAENQVHGDASVLPTTILFVIIYAEHCFHYLWTTITQVSLSYRSAWKARNGGGWWFDFSWRRLCQSRCRHAYMPVIGAKKTKARCWPHHPQAFQQSLKKINISLWHLEHGACF